MCLFMLGMSELKKHSVMELDDDDDDVPSKYHDD